MDDSPVFITPTKVEFGCTSSKFISTVPLLETNTDATFPVTIFTSPIKFFASLEETVSWEKPTARSKQKTIMLIIF